MSKLPFTLAAVGVAALIGSLSTQAQQNTQTLQRQQGQQRADSATYDRAGRQTTDSHGEALTVKEALVQKLKKANEAEIELAKLAMEKTDNQELKELAKMIVEDHQQCNQKLQQMSKSGRDYKTAQQIGTTDPATERQNATTQRQSASTERQNAAGTANATQPAAYEGTASSQAQMVPAQLCKIGEQACDNALKMTKEMLNKYEGQDFQMAFLGQQCVAHTMMLAELNAIAEVGPQELQPMAKEAANKVEMHLKKAKELAKKLEDDRRSNS